jgi:enoyl-CoA hydratase/carnithine racemase
MMNEDNTAPTGRVLLDRSGPVATLTLDNPGKLNAINLAMWGQMIDALESVAADESPRVLVVRGAGSEAFAAGGDLAEFPTRRSTLAQAMDYHERWVAPALDALARCPIPSVAMIRGPCIGGGLEIAACCDVRIAAADASFGAPILRLGFNMYAGELAHVLRVAGPALVSEILLEGRILDASEALQRGLVGRVFPAEALESEVAASCARIAAGAPQVAKAHKAWIRRLSAPSALTVEEKLASLALVDSADYREGLAAFMEKRRPIFTGR